MQPFELHIPTRFFFGNEKSEDYGEALAGLGSHCLLVIGGGSTERLGYYGQVLDLLTRFDIKHTTFRGIEPNPQAKTIDEAVIKAKKAGVDFILGLGGGSVMDASKAIATLLYEGEEHIWDYVRGEDRFGELTGALPISCIPTTAATASEVTSTSVISNPEVRGKAAIYGSFLRPSVSWLNPEFHTDLPLETTRDGASDILSHVFENYLLGGNHAPLTDRYCENIIMEVMKLLPKITENPKDVKLRGRMLWASTMALNGLHAVGRKKSIFPMHAMEHALSGYNPDLAHGRGLATLYPAYFRFLWESGRCRDRLSLLGIKLFNESPDQIKYAALGFITRFENWLKDNGLYQALSDVGISDSAFEPVAQYALNVYGDGKKIMAAGPLTKSDIIEIFMKTESQSEKQYRQKTI